MNKFLGAAALALSLVAAPAFAATTFAQYKQVDGGIDTIVFDDGTLADTGGLAGVLVQFNYLNTMPAALDGDIAAIMQVEASGAPWGGTISFRRASDMANLLTLTFTNAVLSGVSGAGSLLGSTPGGTVAYTSDFLDFTDATGGDFGLVLSGITPGFSSDLWTGDSTGTFASEGGGISTEVPEPATWAMMILGFGGVGAMMRRRRNGALFA